MLEIPLSLIHDADNNNLLKENLLPFYDLSKNFLHQSKIRASITEAWHIPEIDLVPRLFEETRIATSSLSEEIHQMADNLAKNLRHQNCKNRKNTLVQNLLQEFSLSSKEGIVLMCLAEALLRIPDKSTQDAFIREKIRQGNWNTHLGNSSSIFVNITTLCLMVSSRLFTSHITHTEKKYGSFLYKMLIQGGEPIIYKVVRMAVKLIGTQFVAGNSIFEALNKARKLEQKGFSYSYDMLGEAALTKNDAKAYLLSYQHAIHAIGNACHGHGIYENPGISIKLSALHPRYHRTQYKRVMEELYPRLKSITLLARYYNIGINIDAEEAERLDLSLDLLEKLCFEPELENWNGIGFVIQAYQKRCYFLVDALIDLAKRSHHRLMIRLVKGAYWDSEIKHAQIDGLVDYPVFTRKVYTDISYLACAKKLLQVPNFIYPQFATHNAHTLSAIYHMAGNNYYTGQYEFQCLHGMGEKLYEQVVGKGSKGNFNRPCRIYAPVGTYQTLLAYLVRRLLENGANTSFVNRIADKNISIDQLIEDPIRTIEKIRINEGIIGSQHPKISTPKNLYGTVRINSSGINLTNEKSLASLSNALIRDVMQSWIVRPIIRGKLSYGEKKFIINPAKSNDIVGMVWHATKEEVLQALDSSTQGSVIWCTTPAKARGKILERAAKTMQNNMPSLIGLLIREAGKTYSNAISEVREAIDFLYYYANIVINNFDNITHQPLGPIVCISPWNFPLAIFTGQIAAALAAGNSVLAKPAEQTPIIAAQIVQILLASGVPQEVLQFLPGAGETVGQILINDSRTQGVIFTGSTAVAKLLYGKISGRLNMQHNPVPFIAETGGINSMIVDSSALTEQVVVDVMSSAFDSAGQRCSALRLLCIQEEVADHTLKILKGAMTEYTIGNPQNLFVDIGPIIDSEAKNIIELHIQSMRNKGFKVYQGGYRNLSHYKNNDDNFIKPTLIELNQIRDLDKEVFGPVLHVVRFQAKNILNLISDINELGYGLTLGLHTRLDETISQVINFAKVGNIYINRNMIGAIVGVQPFGGEKLSGTGPKAGGPLYLYRLLSKYPDDSLRGTFKQQKIKCIMDSEKSAERAKLLTIHHVLKQWVKKEHPELLPLCQHYENLTLTGMVYQLIGPTGEQNILKLLPRDRVLCLASNEHDILVQLVILSSLGSSILWTNDQLHYMIRISLPSIIQQNIDLINEKDILSVNFNAVIHHGSSEELSSVCQKIATKKDAIVLVKSLSSGQTHMLLESLLIERSISINTTAQGGNTSLMMLNEQ